MLNKRVLVGLIVIALSFAGIFTFALNGNDNNGNTPKEENKNNNNDDNNNNNNNEQPTEEVEENQIIPVVQQVVYVDNDHPVITISGDISIVIEAGTTYTDAGATANDNHDGDITSRISAVNTVNNTKVGDYTVTYTVSDNAGNSTTAVRTVSVVDKTKPEITVHDEGILVREDKYIMEVVYQKTIFDVAPRVTAFDFTQGNMQPTTVKYERYGFVAGLGDTWYEVTKDSSVTSPGEFRITYTFDDTYGNVASITNYISMVNEKPEELQTGESAISKYPVEYVEAIFGKKYADKVKPTAYSQYDNETYKAGLYQICYNGQKPGMGECDTSLLTFPLAQLGTYELGYRVSDSHGHTKYGSRTVIVQDTKAPVLTINDKGFKKRNDSYIFEAKWQGQLKDIEPVVAAYDQGAGDLTSAIVKKYEIYGWNNKWSTIDNTYGITNVGTFRITYTVTDNAGLVTEKVVNIKVVSDRPEELQIGKTAISKYPVEYVEATYGEKYADKVKPTAYSEYDNKTYKAELYQICYNGQKSGMGECDTKLLTFPLTQLGTYELGYRVSDSHGHTKYGTRTVVVQDTKAPVLTINDEGFLKRNDSYIFEVKWQKQLKDIETVVTAYDQRDGDLTSIVDKKYEIYGWNNKWSTIDNTYSITSEGTFRITYTVTDNAGFVAEKVVNIKVVSDRPEELQIGKTTISQYPVEYVEATIEENYIDKVKPTAYSEYDNKTYKAELYQICYNGQKSGMGECDTKLLTFPLTQLGTYELGYRVSDSHGHTKYGTRTVVVQDKKAPVLTINDEGFVKRNDSYIFEAKWQGQLKDIEPVVTAYDQRDGDLTSAIDKKYEIYGFVAGLGNAWSTIDNTYGITNGGIFNITYTVLDKAGNKTTETINIKVVSDIPDELQIGKTTISQYPVEYVEATEGKNYVDKVKPTAYSQYDNKTYKAELYQICYNNTSCDTSTLTFPLTQLGTYELRYRVSDSHGHTKYGSRTVVVQDTIVRLNFNSPVALSDTQASGTWYVDRYAPAGFEKYNFNGQNVLKHSISESDAQSDSFYNYQGRMYDTGDATTVSVDLYIPSDWATTGRNMVGIWGVGYDAANNLVSYPILNFTSDNNNPRFRTFDFINGGYIDMGLPAGFTYDRWYTLSIQLDTINNQFIYKVDNYSYIGTAGGTTRLGNVILQGTNTTTGVSYDIYWDNFVTKK